jgi:hypothetical protein
LKVTVTPPAFPQAEAKAPSVPDWEAMAQSPWKPCVGFEPLSKLCDVLTLAASVSTIAWFSDQQADKRVEVLMRKYVFLITIIGMFSSRNQLTRKHPESQ